MSLPAPLDSNAPRISFVLATFNRGPVLIDCLRQTLDRCATELPSPSNAGSVEILIVDNASTDGTPELVAATFATESRIRLIRRARNEGPVAKNHALPQARGQFIVFLDDDAFPLPGALPRMLAHFAADPTLGAAVFNVLLPDDTPECSAYPDVCIGAGTAFRADVLRQVGGLPPEFFMQAEEYDLSFRILGAGYRIERGKLSFDVAYQLADRQLHAENRLVLDQLTFGEKVDSPSATSLPVQLAIALLKDRDGVIDINLPIGGSLDDPAFSVGGIIVKVLVNLITKAVTAPFALIGNLFGGSSEELSSLEFDPGLAIVDPAREASLKTLAKALSERPGLKLDVTGWADPVADRAALRRLRVDARLRTLKRNDLAARGMALDPAKVVVAPEEYAALVGRVYATQVLDKAPPAPGSAGAHAKAPVTPAQPLPPTAQMEQALRDQEQVSDDDLRALGNRRAQAAKDWLRTVGLVPEDRMALVDAKIGPAAAGAAAATPDAAAAPAPAAPKSNRVEFGLR